MKQLLQVLHFSPLASGIEIDDLDAMLRCLGARVQTYEKDEPIYFEGDEVTEIGIAISGRLHIVKYDIWGNTSIMAEITPPGMFAEAIVCSGASRLPVSVVSKDKSEILFLNYKKIITSCSSSCNFHSRLIRNMISILAQKNIMLSAKMEHITKRTIKEKLLSYLADQAKHHNSKAFDIPFNRQELADYLSVERSALSAEMSRLKSEGIIDYRKNHFELCRETTG